MNTNTITAVHVTETPEAIAITCVDIAPTWGTIGLLFRRLIASREWAALDAGKEELARVFAMAQAFHDISKTLTDAQAQKAAKSMAQSLKEQGF